MVTTKEVVVRDYLLEEIAREQIKCEKIAEEIARLQWQADIPGGRVSSERMKITERKLAQLKMTVDDPRYREVYERVRKDI